ncbi:MAG: hypothetical protein JWO47_511 [Candidatus Saccharibacteria bacterium]|nr:hypothetical protein [Candidatus Saccharibacteria bacterium]
MRQLDVRESDLLLKLRVDIDEHGLPNLRVKTGLAAYATDSALEEGMLGVNPHIEVAQRAAERTLTKDVFHNVLLQNYIADPSEVHDGLTALIDGTATSMTVVGNYMVQAALAELHARKHPIPQLLGQLSQVALSEVWDPSLTSTAMRPSLAQPDMLALFPN